MSPQTMYIAEYKKSISATKKGILDPKSKRKKRSSAKAENKALAPEQVKLSTSAEIAVKPEIKTELKTKTLNKTIKLKDKPAASRATETESSEFRTRKSAGGFEAIEQRSYRQGDFQAMFFEVAGLMIAVPLIELGGILNNDKTTALMGKPDWFKGVMLHRDEKVSVVDTARWVMPEKCDEALLTSLNYQYIIMLSGKNYSNIKRLRRGFKRMMSCKKSTIHI